MFDTIIGVDELAARLEDADWLIFDVRHLLADLNAGRRLYEQAHLPGAFFADVEHDLSGAKTGSNGRHPLPVPDAFAAFLRKRGASERTQIVAYDGGGDMFAARFWFVTRYIGHRAVAVLDGGYAAWVRAGKPTTSQRPSFRTGGDLGARTQSELLVDVDRVLASLPDRDLQLLDARGADRFAGENETIDPVGGHIPGARNRSFRFNFAADGHFKAPGLLRAEFAALGIPPERLVHQCGSGVSATVNMLAMEIAGLSSGRIYPGSWSEWCADPHRPIER